MFQVLLVMVGLAAVSGQKGSDGFTDEERPYEFGFNIEGYQHRHEKKGLSQQNCLPCTQT
jgi:hypothetical protein